jgi:DNA-binding beta-propeller fold protein YncE
VRRSAALLAALAAVAGCGSQDDPRDFPPAAEPARSPAPDERPAGRVVPVGNKPEGMAADARTGLLAVALTDPDELALVDMRTLEVVRRLALPGAPRHLRLAGPGGPVIVPCEGGDALVLVSLERRRIAATTPVGDGPHDADAVPGRVFVGDEFAGTLSIVEGGRVVEKVPTPLQPGGVAVVRPGGPVVVVGVRERAIAAYDVRDVAEIARVPAGVGPTHVEAGEGGRVYVADTDGDAVLLFTADPELDLVRRVRVAGSPYGMTLDRRRGKLWVTQTALNRVTQLTADGQPRPERSFPTVRQPNSVAIDEATGTVFVASRSDGTLQAFAGYPPRR